MDVLAVYLLAFLEIMFEQSRELYFALWQSRGSFHIFSYFLNVFLYEVMQMHGNLWKIFCEHFMIIKLYFSNAKVYFGLL